MDVDPRETSLWKAAFADEHCETQAQIDGRAELLVELQKLERHVADLLSRIPESCRQLTLHDIAHVHQLWDIASRLCGPKYPINPLEGFVLGAAFLIHDAGLTAASYPNGLEGLKASSLYRDLVSNALKRDDPDRAISPSMIDNAPTETAEPALFAVLRGIHADRAEHLLDRKYIHPITKASFTLIPADLLFDAGEAIGKVAASHNWTIRRVDNIFGDPLSPPAAYPDWTIDALKLACILRAADACAIDERRARTMAFIITNPRGVSHSHWAFQNLLNPGYLPESSEALIFRSKRPFPREELDSWWVAFDAIGVADNELRACDRLLKRRAGKHGHDSGVPLKAKRVEGAGDPDVLSKYVSVDGWQPVDASARIDDPLAVIESLGGINLYGNDFSAPLRELLQNSADAVRARRWLNGYEQTTDDPPGNIRVIVTNRPAAADSWTFTVIDDGIGMPEDVLTGEFLDFGKSLWRSDRLASLYPGLAAKESFRPTGRFGIGFYAAFTIADDVKVMTKPYRGGDADRRVLHFKKGVRGRAELRLYDENEDGAWPPSASTIVELTVKDLRWFGQFAGYAIRGGIKTEPINDNIYWELFSKSLEILVFSLDVATTLTCPFIVSFRANKIDPFNVDNETFVSEWNRVFGNSPLGEAIDPKLHGGIDIIGESGQSRSRGRITTSSGRGLGFIHVGGFTSHGVVNGAVQGIVECVPITTNRQGVKSAESQDAFRRWGERQLSSADIGKLKPDQLSEALLALWSLDVDIDNYYYLWDLSGKMVFFQDFEFVDHPTIFLALESPSYYPGLRIGQFQLPPLVGNAIKKAPDFTFVLCNPYGFTSSYNRVALPFAAGAPDDRTAFRRLVKRIDDAGFDVELEGPETYIVGHYIGPDGGVNSTMKDLSLKKGDPTYARGIVIRTNPKPGKL